MRKQGYKVREAGVQCERRGVQREGSRGYKVRETVHDEGRGVQGEGSRGKG